MTVSWLCEHSGNVCQEKIPEPPQKKKKKQIPTLGNFSSQPSLVTTAFSGDCCTGAATSYSNSYILMKSNVFLVWEHKKTNLDWSRIIIKNLQRCCKSLDLYDPRQRRQTDGKKKNGKMHNKYLQHWCGIIVLNFGVLRLNNLITMPVMKG